MIALVDCNNFYASCERVFRPDLLNKPVVVLSNNDGCIIARSSEAKELGIPMAAAAHEWIDTIEKNNINVFSSNYALYGDMSQRVMNILSGFAPEIEIYSIDESFLNLSGINENLYDYARLIQDRVKKWVGIPVSIGIAPTKTLAKLANRISKKFADRQGIHIIDSEEKRLKAIKWAKVDDLWGIGSQHHKKLQSFGVHTAWDITQHSDSFMRKHFTVVGLRTKKELEGTPCFTFENNPPTKKNIATTRSFGTLQTELDKIQEAVSTFASNSAQKLRKQNSCAQTMMVFIHTNGFRKEHKQYSRNIVIKLPVATNSSAELSRYARKMVEVIYKPGYYFHKAGVILSDILPQDQIQMNIFDKSDRNKFNQIYQVVDRINQTMGRETLRLAAQGKERMWKLKQEKLSKQYTTKWKDILEI